MAVRIDDDFVSLGIDGGSLWRAPSRAALIPDERPQMLDYQLRLLRGCEVPSGGRVLDKLQVRVLRHPVHGGVGRDVLVEHSHASRRLDHRPTVV